MIPTMLNPFPDLLLLSVLVPLLLRLTSSFFLARIALRHASSRSTLLEVLRARGGRFAKVGFYCLLAGESIAALFLLFGFLTQIGALLGLGAIIATKYLRKRDPKTTREEQSLYTLLAVVLFTLLLSGAGPFAVDLPL